MFEKARSRGELDQIWQARADGGNLPLHIASKLGNASAVEWIFKTWDDNSQNLKVDALDEEGQTALFLVCQQGYPSQDQSSRTDEETKENRLKIVKMLVARGANVNFVASKNKMTPLHWLAFNDDRVCAKFLLDFNAKQQFNDKKNSPVDIAGFSRLPEMIDLFIEDLHAKIRPKYPAFHYIHRVLEKCEDGANDLETSKSLLN